MSATENSSEEKDGTESDPLVGTVIAERYRIDQLLGTGGMGAVYRAEHVLMQKPVAVKILHREMTVLDEVVKRFEREAIAAGRIEHPNVTVATDFGKLADGAFYLVLEYVPGQSLTRAILVDGAFPEERALFVARQIASGLGAAHAAGIVHRDLKPDNVMLIERGNTKDFVKVLDFGIAKVDGGGGGGGGTAPQLTRLGSVFGTPAYMSPEQAAGKTVDHRADLYSLGLVLYEMLAGHPAFESEELVGLLTKQLIEPPPPLPESVSPETRAIVMRLLEKDPAARFQDTTELIAAIDARLGPLAPAPDSSALGVPSARGVPVSSGRGSSASVVARAATALGPARTFASPLLERGASVVLGGPVVEVGGRPLPIRLVGAGVLSLVLTVAGATWVHRAGHRGIATSPSAEPAPPELSDVIRRAASGDRDALRELALRPERGRTSAEWVAIGKGRSVLGEPAVALDAFEHAVALDAAVAGDAAVLHAVRLAADDDKAQKRALEFASGPLREGGADLLFDVWTSTHEKTAATQLAKSYLDREDVRKNASPALRVALELRRVTKCEEAKKLVVEAAQSGDERSTRPLSALASRKGCGFLGLGDCFSCLRGDDTLSGAQKAVAERKGPRL